MKKSTGGGRVQGTVVLESKKIFSQSAPVMPQKRTSHVPNWIRNGRNSRERYRIFLKSVCHDSWLKTWHTLYVCGTDRRRNSKKPLHDHSRRQNQWWGVPRGHCHCHCSTAVYTTLSHIMPLRRPCWFWSGDWRSSRARPATDTALRVTRIYTYKQQNNEKYFRQNWTLIFLILIFSFLSWSPGVYFFFFLLLRQKWFSFFLKSSIPF